MGLGSSTLPARRGRAPAVAPVALLPEITQAFQSIWGPSLLEGFGLPDVVATATNLPALGVETVADLAVGVVALFGAGAFINDPGEVETENDGGGFNSGRGGRFGGGGGDGIALAAGLAPTDLLWPCASWPAPQGGDGVVSMSAELLGDQRRVNRIRAQLRRYGAEAALPSFEGHANATCPQQSRLLAYLNASLPPFDRPRVVAADLVDGAPVVLLASASGRRADTTLLEVTSREVESARG